MLVLAFTTPRPRSPLPVSCGFRCKAGVSSGTHGQQKKIVVVGSGWAGLSAAHHLSKQGYDVTILEAGSCPREEVGINGFRFPYRNIFSLVDELGIDPFTNWTRSAQYSPDGIEVEFPIFRDLPRLPTPLGAILYPQFFRLPFEDRLTALPLMAAVTAREIFKQFGCSERLYRELFNPMLQVGLFAPAEQCSAATTLGMLYYFMLSHQQNFDMLWCWGMVRERIFIPWLEIMEQKGCKTIENKLVTDFLVEGNTGYISGVVCEEEVYNADAVVLAVGISDLQSIVMSSSVLQTKQEFLNVLNLSAIDVLSVKVWLDRKVNIPKPSNVCFGFDNLAGWTFFDLNAIHEEYEDETATILKSDFYYASSLMPLKDDQILEKVMSCLSKCIKEFEEAIVLQHVVTRFSKSVSHFFPGSYKHMMRGSTNFPNLFMAGDWIITRHGSWAQEKAFVTGVEAANRVVDYFRVGNFSKIIPVEEDEPHIQTLRSLNRNVSEIRNQLPFSEYFL